MIRINLWPDQTIAMKILPTLAVALLANTSFAKAEVSEQSTEAPSSIVSDSTEETSSVIEVIALAQRKSTLPLIRYCLEQQPELTEQLKTSFVAYGAKVDEAMAPLIEEYRDDPSAQRSATELASIEQTLMAQVDKKISNLKIADSAHYCRWMMSQLDAIEVDQFRAQIKEGYELMRKIP